MREQTMCYHLFGFKQHPKFVGTFRCTLFHLSFNSFYQNPRSLEQLNNFFFSIGFLSFLLWLCILVKFQVFGRFRQLFFMLPFHIFCRGYGFWLSMAWRFVGVMMCCRSWWGVHNCCYVFIGIYLSFFFSSPCWLTHKVKGSRGKQGKRGK
jgi:hypothetical protein